MDEIGRFFECRARRRPDVDAQLAGDELGERGLAEAGRARKQDVVERFAATECGVDRNPQVVFCFALADELGEALRSEGQLHGRLIGDDFGRGDFGARHVGK